jgi:hypothetical protein
MAPDAAALDAAEVHGPGDLQVLHVIAVDLLQTGEPVSRVILMMMKPVARLLVDVEQPFLIDLVAAETGNAAIMPPAATATASSRARVKILE